MKARYRNAVQHRHRAQSRCSFKRYESTCLSGKPCLTILTLLGPCAFMGLARARWRARAALHPSLMWHSLVGAQKRHRNQLWAGSLFASLCHAFHCASVLDCQTNVQGFATASDFPNYWFNKRRPEKKREEAKHTRCRLNKEQGRGV